MRRLGPPPRVRLLLRWLLPSDVRGAAVLGDLDEEHEERRRAGLPADAWYRRQAARVGLRYALPIRIRRARRRLSHSLTAPIRGLPADASFAWRSLRAAPVFAAAAIVVLSLGIGLATTAFTAIDAVLLESLPFAAADRVVQIWDEHPGYEGRASSVSEPNLADYRGISAFERVVAVAPGNELYTTGERIESWSSAAVSADFFTLSPLEPRLGRTLAPGDDRRVGGEAIMISHRLWREQFEGAGDVVGRRLELLRWSAASGNRWVPLDARIVGVLPAGYRLPAWRSNVAYVAGREVDVLTTLAVADWGRGDRGKWAYRVFASLRPGTSLERARDELDAVAAGIAAQHPETNEGYRAVATPVSELLYRTYGASLGAAFGGALLVLLIGCANVSSLLFSRGATRQREIAVRSALGAGRMRLCRQLLLEGAALGLAGAGGGLLIAVQATGMVRALADGSVYRAAAITPDARAFTFALLAALATTLLCAVGPAVRGTARSTLGALRSPSRGHRIETLRSLRLLVVAQVALSLALLTAATLLVASAMRLAQVETGVDTQGVVRADLTFTHPRLSKYQGAARQAFLNDLVARLGALRGVQGAAMIDVAPLAPSGVTDVTIPRPGRAPRTGAATWRRATAGYFRVAGVGLHAGGLPNADHVEAYDRAARVESQLAEWDWAGRGAPLDLLEEFFGSPLPVWISVGMARAYWPDRDPIGERFYWGRQAAGAVEAAARGDLGDEAIDPRYPYPQHLEVVGVVADVRSASLAAPPPQYYTLGGDRLGAMLVRLDPISGPSLSEVRDAIRSADPREVMVAELRTLSDVFGEVTAPSRQGAALAVACAMLAALLAGAGLFGVLAYSSTERTHEFGVRISMGARAADVARLVLHDAGRLVGVGAILGAILAVAVATAIRSLLYEVSPLSPAALGVAVAVVAVVALVASAAPAMRALQVDPARVLRQD